MTRNPLSLVLLCCLTVSVQMAAAGDFTWIGGSAEWNDSNTAVWAEAAVPVIDSNVHLTQSATGALTIDFAAGPLDPNGYGILHIQNDLGETALQIGSGDTLKAKNFWLYEGSALNVSGGQVLGKPDIWPSVRIDGGELTITGGEVCFSPIPYENTTVGADVSGYCQ